MKETNLTDEELNAFLHELGLYDKSRVEKKNPPPRKREHKRQNSSLKISLYVTLALVLFSLVQAAFTLPLYMEMKKLETSLESALQEIKKIPVIPPLPQEFLPTDSEEEIIEPLEEELYNKA